MGMSDVLTADVEVAGGVSVEVVEEEEDVLEDVVDVLDVDEDSEDVEEEVEVEMEVEGRSQYFVDAEMLTADFHYYWFCPTQMMLASRRHMMILHIKLSDINSVLSGLWAPWAGCSFPISICSNYTVSHGPRSFSVSRINHVGQDLE